MDKIIQSLRNRNVSGVLVAVAIMMAISVMYFFPDDVQGNVLQQPDTRQGLAVGHEEKMYKEATGETTYWTNSLFGGMPMFQISPSYASNRLIDWITPFLTLGLPAPANLLFLMMIGFYIFLLSMRMRWYIALLGALAWGLSSYFMILIGAGHIWKYLTLAYIPPTLAGVVFCYRGKNLIGGACTALFGMMQLSTNHVQMTYYFLFVAVGIVIYFFIKARQTKNISRWVIATAMLIIAAVLSVSANLPNLYNTYHYSKETIRGNHSDIVVENEVRGEGLDKHYITQYSYGVSETMSLLIPNIKGGASAIPMKGKIEPLTLAQLDEAKEMERKGSMSPATAYNLQFLYQYFGGEEGTNGPVYVGALIVAMFILGCMIVRGPIKWVLLILTSMSVLLSWGRNCMWITQLFIDYVPMYSKFRTPESILVIAQFTIPLLGIMALKQILQIPADDSWQRYGKKIIWSFALTSTLCLIGVVFPGFYGTAIPGYEIQMGVNKFPELCEIAEKLRYGMIRSDSLRSLIIVFMGLVIVMLYFHRKNTLRLFIIALGMVLVGDLYRIDKRYVNHDCFMERETIDQTSFPLTESDKHILSDTSMNYRVMDFPRFASPDPSYYHKMIGGYHPAKLTRYQDMIDYYLRGERDFSNMLNMLNARYIVEDINKEPYFNTSAMGNAWIVDSVRYVDSPNDEISFIENIDLRSVAVSDIKFKPIIGKSNPKSHGDTIYETSYAPNRLTYRSESKRGGVAVFSEVYFPWGWEATIDGDPVEIARVNYLLRAIKLPAGKHDIEMQFNPQGLKITVIIAYAGIICIFSLFLLSCIITAKRWWVRSISPA